MRNLQTFQVFPAIPEALSFLKVLSRNLWWCWHINAIELFRRISPRLWSKSGHNLLVFLTLVPQERLAELARDDSFLSHLKTIKNDFEKETIAQFVLAESPYGDHESIAYFSMEFSIHESFPAYAGGLGVLAGDHLKAASDLGLPLVGVGLLYRQGYFRQFLDQYGWQQEEYPQTDIFTIPVVRARDAGGNEVTVNVNGPDGNIRAVVWQAMVGRIPLLLLDTNISENTPVIRDITSSLYPGESKKRLSQEVLLGIGGIRALEALGITPSVCHMNEGHSAFSSMERLAQVMSNNKVDLQSAMEIVPRTTIFTTHTPVAAGHDEFYPDLLRPYLLSYRDKLNAEVDEILSWGQPVDSGRESRFSMFIFGMRMAQYRNGVSELHGKVARRIWSHVWPGIPEDEIPISHITNGIHINSWLSIENTHLFERYIGPEWYLNSWDTEASNRIDEIYDEELWRAHEMSRSRLIRTCRELLAIQYGKRNAPKSIISDVDSTLDQDVLTISFARRFATYKRADLLFKDPERLEALINSDTHPIQLIFAGKAHPRDNEGKELIKKISQFCHRPSVRHRVVFLEDYDTNIARHLVQGSDVWLNTPRRPLEACGTSGMKAAINGVLNFSVLDGWWCEGYSDDRGWAIGRGEDYQDHAYQDSVESHALYNILEDDIIPSFYDKKIGGIPNRWVKMMKASIKMILNHFGAHQMVNKYEKMFYLPAIDQYRSILLNNAEIAKILFEQRKRLNKLWTHIKVKSPVRVTDGPYTVGETLHLKSEVFLGELLPNEVVVELYYGSLKSIDSVSSSQTVQMTAMEDRGNGHYMYGCTLTCKATGRYGFTVRVTPRGDDFIKYSPGLITWA